MLTIGNRVESCGDAGKDWECGCGVGVCEAAKFGC